jgi:hypothetical protein
VTLFALIFWSAWLAMLVIGDPLLMWIGGEKLSDTHFLASHIPVGIRAGILGWLIWHFLREHVSG